MPPELNKTTLVFSVQLEGVKVEQQAYLHMSDGYDGAELRLSYQTGFGQQTLQEHFQRSS